MAKATPKMDIVSDRMDDFVPPTPFVPPKQQKGIMATANFDEAERFDSSKLDPRLKELFNSLLNP